MDKKQKFIEKGNKVHDYKYDYSLVEYVNNKTKITLICPRHGSFIVSPSAHTNQGIGCRKCSMKRKNEKLKMTTEQFINRSKSIYGDERYDYSEAEYVSGHLPIRLYDKYRNKWTSPQPYNHLAPRHMKGKGKVNSNPKTTEDFIRDAQNIHGDTYDYSLVDYKNNNTPVKIICPEHGIFTQTRKRHITRKNGCRDCAIKSNGINKRVNVDELIKYFNKIHNNKYTYIIPKDGIRFHGPIDIICPEHGTFTQLVSNHYSKKKCPKCANRFSSHHESIKKVLMKYNIRFIENTMTIIAPLELDFYLPDHNLAIEVNGLYWHSEIKGKNKDYHLNKTNLCKNKGIRLLHINENEYLKSEKIMISYIKNILKIGKYEYNIDNCEIKEVDDDLKIKFLNKYHIQYNDPKSIGFGIFYKNNLISIMCFQKITDTEWEITRYCNNFSLYNHSDMIQILEHFEKLYMPENIYVNLDKRWNNDHAYLDIGFKHKSTFDPKCWYFYKTDRNNVYSHTPKTKIGWNRIWDCGYNRLEKII